MLLSSLQSKQLAMVGEGSVSDAGRRIMYKFMAPDLLATYSFTGRKNTKLPFRETKMYKVVKAAMQLTIKNSSDKDVEESVKNVLKYVKDRLEKRKH